MWTNYPQFFSRLENELSPIAKALSTLIAAHMQAVGLVMAAYYVGDWLNASYPRDFSWYIVTFTVAVIAIAQTFYVVVRYAMRESKKLDARAGKK